MAELTLVIGNRNYSSWSLRPWILIRHLGLACREVRRYSAAARVPVLIDGGVTVWESVAIFEYLNELAGGGVWPAAREARAVARAVVAEMHAGFAALRNDYPMNIRARNRRIPMRPELAESIGRIDELWS